MAWNTSWLQNPVADTETAIGIISNTIEPDKGGLMFVNSHENPIYRIFPEDPESALKSFHKLIGCGVVDRWLDDGGHGFGAKYDHMLHFRPPPARIVPGSYSVPMICISKKFLAAVNDVGEETLTYFFVVTGPPPRHRSERAKLVVRHTWRDAVLAMIEEAMQGYTTVFCGAMLSSYGSDFFDPKSRRRHWGMLPVEEIADLGDRTPGGLLNTPENRGWGMVVIPVLC